MGFPKGAEHPLCDILIGGGVKTPPAKWLRLLFPVSRAVACGLQIQKTFAARNKTNPDNAVKIRIGLTACEPIAEREDLCGTSV